MEGFFSAVKRCFGETVRATSSEGMFREVKSKFALYSLDEKLKGTRRRPNRKIPKYLQQELFNRAIRSKSLKD